MVLLGLARTLVAEMPMALKREGSKNWAKCFLGCWGGVG